MRIQKMLTSANRLPQYDVYPEFVANMNAHADENVLEETIQNINGLLGDLSELNNVSVTRYSRYN